MIKQIQIRRGLLTDLPTLAIGEFGITTDTNQLYIGTATGNMELSSTANVSSEISALIDAAPGALDTLNELAAALGDDANFATTVTNSLATKADKTLSINVQSGTTYTLVYNQDENTVIELTNATECTVTIPTYASGEFAVGTQIAILGKDTGAYTVQGNTGVIVNGTSAGSVIIDGQYKSVALLNIAQDEWVIAGAIA